MSNSDVVRTWKDRRYRGVARETVPAHPAGAVELADERLTVAAAAVRGADDFECSMTGECGTIGCCLGQNGAGALSF